MSLALMYVILKNRSRSRSPVKLREQANFAKDCGDSRENLSTTSPSTLSAPRPSADPVNLESRHRCGGNNREEEYILKDTSHSKETLRMEDISLVSERLRVVSLARTLHTSLLQDMAGPEEGDLAG
jgi:hypothetical protein